MEWMWNSITNFVRGNVLPDFEIASEPPLSDEDIVSDTRDAENEQAMEDPTAIFESEEKSCKDNTETRDSPKAVDIVSSRENYPLTSSENELSSEEQSGEELHSYVKNFQESVVNCKEDDSRENYKVKGQLHNQESVANLQKNSSQFQPLVSKPVILNATKEIVKLPQENEQIFISLLSDLKLNPQEKITLKKARTVDNYTFSDDALTSPDEVPKYILQKLMIVDYRARAFKLDTNRQESSDSEVKHDEDEEEEDEDVKGSVNPMDAFLALFHCCDDFLRQDLVTKLSACQLSVPFLLPHPDQLSKGITMLLWALEGIKKSWKIKDDNGTFKDHQVFVTEHPFPVVSFIRIGENELSKSNLLNKIIVDVNGYHDIFFHKDCRGGGVERKIVNGLVELCWYLPGGRKKQAFEQEICFANLRGDARSFRKQFKVLSKISSAMFLMLPSEYPDPSTQQILEEAMKTEGKLVLVFNSKREGKAKQYFDDLKSANQEKFSTISRALKKNEDDFVVAIRAKIKRNVEDAKLAVPLRNLTSLASDYNILLDESCCEMKTLWRKNIEKWFMKGPKEAKMQLKLQLQVPTIVSLERENLCPTHRGNKSEEEYNDEIYNKIQAARKSQKDSFKQMGKEICQCLNYIPLMDENERDYSLTVLKHNLDRMSLAVLGSLQASYRQTWFDIQRKKRERRQQNDPNHPDQRSSKQAGVNENHLRDMEEAIKESSFGLEHIFREITQMFQLTELSTIDYAGAAAEILLSGQPLELMDGDSSYIPLRWFNAVFGKIKDITKNAKIFVISVLGIQSSGKSTMLNTMFGLEFAVSAGRCTRGAFANLIPLSDSLRHKSRYDYLLIIDTEGLRGSSDPKLRQHDNELATFAIGVADLTIVNVFGENYNEMKEFLEIAVHAFLKMKLVKEKRICQIVHQNVAAINAVNALATERITLKKKLDEMTRLAAIQENCESEIEELNDVLSFDENEDVSYIPSLLQGCPPMAHINPEYGKAIQEVKEKITNLMCLPERLTLSIVQFQKRVSGLWNAILRENFIFSFRNTIEVRAFTSLDQKFFEESVKTMVTEMAELEKTTMVSLMRCPADTRDAIWEVQIMQIREKAEALSKEMEKEMEVFFETNEDKATLEQWRENIMLKIGFLKESQEAEVKKNCQATFNYLQSRQEIDKKKLDYKGKLLANAKEIITSVEETDDVTVRKEIFEQNWQQWIKEVPPCHVKTLNVEKKMMEILCNTNKRINDLMRERYKERGFNIRNFDMDLPSIKNELELGNWEKFKRMFVDKPHLIVDAENIRDKAITSALDFAKYTYRSGVRCRESDLKTMYQKIFNTLNQVRKEQPFKFRDRLIRDILLYSFAKTYTIFEEMEENYYNQHDIKLDLETNLKPDLEEYFLNQCNKMKKEVSAASSFVKVVEKAIKTEINRSMGPAVAKEIVKISEFQSKGQFHAKVLIELGEKNSFSYYIDYLRNPVKFLKEKLQDSIEKYCTVRRTDFSVQILLEKEIEKMKDKIFSAISTANKKVSEDSKEIYAWIDEFVENCSTLAITKDMFFVATIDEHLKEFEIFEDQIETSLRQVFQQILDRGVTATVLREWHPTPFDKLVDLMFGCDKCCPFCRALCDQTLKNHENQHSIRIHRPQGITGYRYEGSNILVAKICSTNVAGTSKFRNHHTSNEWHPYKNYQTVNDYYKSWSIAPDSSFEASSYWKWFMATYASELAKHYQTKTPDIPLAWKKISFEEAKNQIQEEYNLG